ncbi:hypothetical protein N7603_07620 [Acholeplasma vituli]|uniref:Lipoprotein n=1 Tax=Paracholeplasma vituli TaxID=69473 RepID=A0ABT2PX43_9MOLU|nr:hypothetical protein [Paracholeplasma vituli]MCU0105525.1 hypothetical protein [Paracholeplasma vituli]
MKRSIALKIIVVTLLTLLLSGCNQMERFDRDVRKIEMEESGYVIVSEYAISKNYKHQMVYEKIEAALDDANIAYNEHITMMTTRVIGRKLFFQVYTGLGGNREEQIPESVRGVVDIDTLAVTIYSVYYDHSEDISFKLIDQNHALIRYLAKVELVQLNPYTVLDTLLVTGTNLLTYNDQLRAAFIKDQVLTVYSYTNTGYETNTYNIETSETFDRLYDHYLINTRKKLAYNIQTQTFVDYDSILSLYPSNEMPLYQEIFNDTLTVLDKTWTINEFMNQTETLKAFKKELGKYDRMFNRYAIFTQNGETYIALNYDGGGLLFLVNATHQYIFKLVDGIPVYVASHPYELGYFVLKPQS